MAKNDNTIEYSEDQLEEHEKRERKAATVNKRILDNRDAPISPDAAPGEDNTVAAVAETGKAAPHAAEEARESAKKTASRKS